MKHISLFLAGLLLAGDLRAALTFGAATSDRVDHGSGSTLDNLNPYTQIQWVFPTTLTSAHRLTCKGSDQRRTNLSGTTGNLQHFVDRTTDTSYVTNDTPLSTTSKWYLVSSTFDSAASAGQIVNIYTGDLATIAVERTYGTATDGSSTITSDAANNQIIGNRSNADVAFQGAIGLTMIWNRVLTLGEIRAQQFKPRKTSGCVLFAIYGFNGTGTQADWSGNGNNGTVTGATVSSHVPLPAPFATIFWRFFLRARPRPATDFIGSDGALDIRRYLRNLDAPEISYGW